LKPPTDWPLDIPVGDAVGDADVDVVDVEVPYGGLVKVPVE
jgi:hypothetical protein